MPSKFEQEESLIRSEKQRLEDRRFDSALAFETMPDAEYQRRLGPQFSQPIVGKRS